MTAVQKVTKRSVGIKEIASSGLWLASFPNLREIKYVKIRLKLHVVCMCVGGRLSFLVIEQWFHPEREFSFSYREGSRTFSFQS